MKPENAHLENKNINPNHPKPSIIGFQPFGAEKQQDDSDSTPQIR